jgi:hypothetical protein
MLKLQLVRLNMEVDACFSAQEKPWPKSAAQSL